MDEVFLVPSTYCLLHPHLWLPCQSGLRAASLSSPFSLQMDEVV